MAIDPEPNNNNNNNNNNNSSSSSSSSSSSNNDTAAKSPPCRKWDWRLFFILWLMSTLAAPCVVPYALTLAKVPLTQAILLRNLLAGAVISTVVVAPGLFLAHKTGLKVPVLEGLLQGKNMTSLLKSVAGNGLLLGFNTGVIVILIGIVIAGGRAHAAGNPPVWQGLLACFYGGICEELQCRLLLMSLLVWLCALVRREGQKPSCSSLWTANILAALLFGAAHLPTAASLTPLTLFIIVAVVIPNAVCGTVFGYLFFTLGLEAAMIAHFTTDVILHVIAPLLLPR
jgi:hypothetical protein